MPAILVFSEDGAISRQLLTPGLALKESMQQKLIVVTLANDPQQFISRGADGVFVLQGQDARSENIAEQLAELAKAEQANVLLLGGTLRGKDVAARVAALLHAALISDAQEVKFSNGSLETSRVLYAGLAVCEDVASLPALVTIPPRTFAEPAATGGQGEVKTVDVKPDLRVTVLSTSPIESEGVDISAATKIVSVGRGFREKKDLQLAEHLAKRLGAEIACTRGVAEDYHWLPLERYIGISGQKVKPELYLGAAVSGQVQHLVGMRESKIIVAVNSDEKAPIFAAADYGIVGDLYEVLPLLTAALKDS